MSFRKLRLFPITTTNTTGYPTYGTPIPLNVIDGEELNSIEITLTNEVKEKTLAADDIERIKRKVVRYAGTIKAYNVSAEAAKDLFGFTLDANDNVIQVENSSSKKEFGLFFEGTTSEDKVIQKYLYRVKFQTPDLVQTTDDGTVVQTIDLAFDGYLLSVGGKDVKSATVYAGNTGYVTDEPTEMYEGTTV